MKMPYCTLQLSFLLLLAFSPTHASESLYQQQCVACHAQDGSGNPALNAPSIAGLEKEYLARQLIHFKRDIRVTDANDHSGMMMAGVAKSLGEKDISSLSNYLASRPFIAAKAGKENGGFMGRGLYAGCQSCHGAHAQGESRLQAPRLAGQHTGYLKSQIIKFKSGQRGQHPKDKFGKQMHLIAQDLDIENHLEKILGYIAHRKVPTSLTNKGHH